MYIPLDQGRAELAALHWKRDHTYTSKDGEAWLPPKGYPRAILQYVGPDKESFDRDQLSYVLGQANNPGPIIH